MEKFLPGTRISAEADSAESTLDSVFTAGGLMLSQVCNVTGIEPYTVQNWVRRKYVSPPTGKKYSKRQFCRIVIINMLKDAMSLDSIVKVLSYINGRLDDESDDMIDDSELYILFIKLMEEVGEYKLESLDDAIGKLLSSHNGSSDVKEHLSKVLRIMATAFAASNIKLLTISMVNDLD